MRVCEVCGGAGEFLAGPPEALEVQRCASCHGVGSRPLGPESRRRWLEMKAEVDRKWAARFAA